MLRGSRQAPTYSAGQVKRVLDSIGLQVASEVNTDYIVFCPFHSNSNTPAAEISKDSGILYCFSCKAVKHLPDIVMQQTGKTYFQALRFIDERGSRQSIVDEIDILLAPKAPEFDEFDNALVMRLHEKAIHEPRAMDYFNSRGITRQSVLRYLLGYSQAMDMITIPVHSPDNVLVGFVGRSIEGKQFKNSSKLPRSRTLFNLNRAKYARQVFVLESAIDAILIEQAGGNAVATLGASISKRQIDLLKNAFNDIIVLGDMDSAGTEMNNTIINALGPFASIGTLPTTDIADMTPTELNKYVLTYKNPLHILGDKNVTART